VGLVGGVAVQDRRLGWLTMTGEKSTGDEVAADPATLIRQVRVLERKLARSEGSRVRLEEAKDRFDT
jgi:hypothetical protein